MSIEDLTATLSRVFRHIEEIDTYRIYVSIEDPTATLSRVPYETLLYVSISYICL